ncbi:gluconate 2-dehydrogenase subunit 3 family protein [Catenovulum sediminis]|uniref:Gluconate 2-dehydrogenase subunit 3 family protein n=1 Tax=Catenovulum sediminis TaxID=1740262 RepID=A0ABV1RJH5_9ALTE
MSDSLNLKRRSLLQGLGAVLGTAAACNLLGGNAIAIANAYTPKPNSHKLAGEVFSQPQMQMLRDICAHVIPKTDTPGAVDVDCHGFVDHQLKHVHEQSAQSSATAILDKINQVCRTRFSKGFIELNDAQQLDILQQVEALQGSFSKQDETGFKLVKSLIVFGYYTSQSGAMQELRYLPVPGGFRGSVPYKDVGTAWSSKAYY